MLVFMKILDKSQQTSKLKRAHMMSRLAPLVITAGKHYTHMLMHPDIITHVFVMFYGFFIDL